MVSYLIKRGGVLGIRGRRQAKVVSSVRPMAVSKLLFCKLYFPTFPAKFVKYLKTFENSLHNFFKLNSEKILEFENLVQLCLFNSKRKNSSFRSATPGRQGGERGGGSGWGGGRGRGGGVKGGEGWVFPRGH